MLNRVKLLDFLSRIHGKGLKGEIHLGAKFNEYFLLSIKNALKLTKWNRTEKLLGQIEQVFFLVATYFNFRIP